MPWTTGTSANPVAGGGGGTVGLMDDKPEVRIGSSERERAQSALNEHFSAGRLDMGEFEERSSLAAAARTFGELSVVFIDLPGGLPAALSAPRVQVGRSARRRVSSDAIRAALGPVLVLLLLLGVFTGHGWLLFLILPMSGAAQQRTSRRGPQRLGGPGPRQP